MRLPIVDFPGAASSEGLRPLASLDHGRFHEALAGGELKLQRCLSCGSFRYPLGPVCGVCESHATEWAACSGRGVIHSWTRYHRPFVEVFRPLVPYAVAAVRLEEGPVVMGRLLGAEPPVIGGGVRAVVERWADGFCGLAFRGGEDEA